MEHNNKKVAEKQLEGLKTELTEMITQDPPTPVDDCLAAIKAKKTEFALADSELVKVSSQTASALLALWGFLGHTLMSGTVLRPCLLLCPQYVAAGCIVALPSLVVLSDKSCCPFQLYRMYAQDYNMLQCPEIGDVTVHFNRPLQYTTMLEVAVMQIIFTVLIDAISTVGKNGQQILSLILKQIKMNAKLLTSFTTSGRVESALISHVQVLNYQCLLCHYMVSMVCTCVLLYDSCVSDWCIVRLQLVIGAYL